MSQKRKSSQLTPKGTEGTMGATNSEATSSQSSATPSKHQRKAAQVFATSTQQKSTVIPDQQNLRLKYQSQLTPKGTEGTMSVTDPKATSSQSSAIPSKHQRRASQVFAASTKQKSTVIPAQQKLRLEVETGSWQFNH